MNKRMQSNEAVWGFKKRVKDLMNQLEDVRFLPYSSFSTTIVYERFGFGGVGVTVPRGKEVTESNICVHCMINPSNIEFILQGGSVPA